MTQVTNYLTPGAPILMSALKTFLDNCFGAVGSSNRGSTAPSNPFEGMMWFDSSSTPTELWKRYSVAFGWITIGTFNTDTGAWTPAGAGAGDVTGAAASVDMEVCVFSGTGGKTIKRTTLTGMLKAATGVLSAATAGVDYSAGTSSLATGILKSTNTTGALSIATAGTDYAKPDTKSAWSKQQSGTQYALTSTSNHIATDCDNGNNFSHTMTENTTLDNPSNIVAGTDYKWTFTQITAEKTLALGNYFKPSDGKAFVGLPTTDGAIVTLIAYAETSTRLVCALNKEGQT